MIGSFFLSIRPRPGFIMKPLLSNGPRVGCGPAFSQTMGRARHPGTSKMRSLLNSRDGVSGAEPSRHVDQPEVRDDGVAVLQEYVLRLEILFGFG